MSPRVFFTWPTVIPEEVRLLLEEVNKHEQRNGWLATAIAMMTEARRRK